MLKYAKNELCKKRELKEWYEVYKFIGCLFFALGILFLGVVCVSSSSENKLIVMGLFFYTGGIIYLQNARTLRLQERIEHLEKQIGIENTKDDV